MRYLHDMERRGLLPGTIHQAGTQLRGWRRWLEDRGRSIFTATEEDVQLFLDGKRISARTRYNWLSCLHNFYGWAVREGLAEADPTARIVRPRLRKTLPRPVTDDDLRVALTHADPEMRAWLMLAAYAGLRCAEIAGLQADDISADTGLMRVLGKGHKERLVPLHPAVLAALKAARIPRSGPLFVRPMGGAWKPHLVSRRINEYLCEIGVEATAHQFRHWFATRTYGECHDIRVVQELLGHSSPTTTAIYTAFSQTEATAAVHALRDHSDRTQGV